ncbi:MAG: prolyl oligopeptidase family serine peptidase [Parasporobacterium sp.]|nr:prolyl oligopeptidase family serine peptidase [Parasporobacterium sp.]
MYQYDIEWTVNDDGAQNRRLILHLPQNVKIADVSPDKFSVYVERKNKKGELLYVRPKWDDPSMVLTKGYRTVIAAYPSDEKGNPVLEGAFITLEMDMEDIQSRALVGELDGNFFVDSFYRVTQTDMIGDLSGMVFDEPGQIYCPEAEHYTSTISSYEPLPLQYSYYTPETGDGKRPCIIWLHGAGEGGEDPRVSYLGNRVTALSSDPVQKFMGGAWVLVPTCPTMWMDDGSHEYGTTGKSMYAEALFALIDEFVRSHEVDPKRIYIGGCSNGGFMTMRQIVDHPDYFAAGYPMCEALYDNTISDAEIEQIKDVPIWFLHAMTDMVVDPEITSVPTYKRLMAAGAGNTHFTYIDDRPPLNRMVNHGCWPLGLNNELNYDFDGQPVLLDGKPVTRFEWLAAMHK